MTPTHDLISFDLDGTLVDTAEEIAAGANRALAAIDIAPRAVDEIRLLIGGGMHNLMRGIGARLSRETGGRWTDADTRALTEGVDVHYAAVIGTLARPYAGVEVALQQLRDAGVRVACVTNKESAHAAHLLARLGMADAFDLLIGGDSLSVKKPDAQVLRQAALRCGASLARTAHVGDSSIDIDAARNAGVAAWAVPYGYNGGVPIESHRPDLMFDDVNQVVRHVLRSSPT